MYEQGGDLPRWPIGHGKKKKKKLKFFFLGYTGCMTGQHTDVIITDGYLKGLRNFNYTKAYEVNCFFFIFKKKNFLRE